MVGGRRMIRVNDMPVKIDIFPNGESRIDLLQFDGKVDVDRLIIDFDYRSETDLIHLMMLKRAIDHSGSKFEDIILSIGYMPYSRMDRQTTDVFSLKYVTELINSLHFDQVEVYEPHSDVTMALLDNSIPIYPSSEWLLLEALDDTSFDENYDQILFPDAGAQKRYSGLDKYNTMTATKH